MNKTLVVNFYSGPSTGKSTMAAGVYTQLKKEGVNCELVVEFARDLIWEESYRTLQNQIYVFAHQFHRLWRLKERVDVAIVDSPLLLTLAYDSTGSQPFKDLVYEQYQTFDNMDYFLTRMRPFDSTDEGRVHDEEESKRIDRTIKHLLEEFDVSYESIEPGEELLVTQQVLHKLGREKADDK